MAKKSKKRQRRDAALIVSLLIGLGGVLADPVATILTDDTPVVVCSTDVAKYVDLAEDNPEVDFTVDEDSELNKQCKLNDVLDSLEPDGPAEIGPADPQPSD